MTDDINELRDVAAGLMGLKLEEQVTALRVEYLHLIDIILYSLKSSKVECNPHDIREGALECLHRLIDMSLTPKKKVATK